MQLGHTSAVIQYSCVVLLSCCVSIMTSVKQLISKLDHMDNSFSDELYTFLEILGEYVDKNTNLNVFRVGLSGLKCDIKYIEELALENRSVNKLGLNKIHDKLSCLLTAVFIVYTRYCIIKRKSQQKCVRVFEKLLSRLKTVKFNKHKIFVQLLWLNVTLHRELHQTKNASRQCSNANKRNTSMSDHVSNSNFIL